jgi:hypothetical protein
MVDAQRVGGRAPPRLQGARMRTTIDIPAIAALIDNGEGAGGGTCGDDLLRNLAACVWAAFIGNHHQPGICKAPSAGGA